ncbi:SLC13 family permease [Comamonadaceae bacterium G21597-S1]|nr:SLC13 family permease [Comamonadaceae bacterium G21597-S1]
MNATSAVMQQATLGAHGLAMIVFAIVVFAVFIWDRWPIATVSLFVLAAIPLGFVLAPLADAQGPVDPTRFFLGLGHPALVAICALMVLGQALVVTGALEPVARRLSTWVTQRPRLALLAVLLGAASVSGLINDTPVVVLLIPLILAAAARARVAAGAMLLPMNYAVLMGGMATSIGTSTNLIVVALAAGLGVTGLGMFSFTGIVAVAAVPAMAYLWLVAPRLLAHVQPRAEQLSEQVFDAELSITEDSSFEGQTLGEAFGASGNRLQLVELRRNKLSIVKLPSVTLRAGDILVVQGTARDLKELEATLDAPLHSLREQDDAAGQHQGGDASDAQHDDAADDGAAERSEAVPSAMVAQLVVVNESPLVRRTVRQERLAERYGVIVVGLRPRTKPEGWERQSLADRMVRGGDILLLQGKNEDIARVQRDGYGLLLDARYTLPRQEKAWIALAVMATVVVLAATKTLPIALAALAGVIVLLLARCVSWDDVAQSLSVKVILLVASSLALGDALSVTGATAWGAQQLAGLTDILGPNWLLVLLMGLMGLLTNFVSNNAAAAIGTPLGVELARSLGVNPEPFVLAVLFGCNLCYLTPMGYQTNLLVMNAGGYRFGDFVRVGTPLFLIMWAGLSYGLILQYGL